MESRGNPRQISRVLARSVLMAAAALTFAAGPVQADEATNIGQDAGRTAFASAGSLDAPPLAKRWTTELGASVSYPLIADGLVFTVSTDACPTSYCGYFDTTYRLSALDVDDGTIRWWRPVSEGAKIAYDRGRVFITAGRALSAVSAQTGELDWIQQQTDTMTAPVAVAGLVYVNYAYGTLQAWDGATGELRWSNYTGLRSPPVVDAENVYVTRDYYCDPKAFDREDGTPIWSTTRDCTNSDDMAVDGGRVVVRGSPGLSLDAANGKTTANVVATRPPALAGSTGVFPNGRRLQGVNLMTGEGVWDFTGDGALGGSPLVVNNTAYVGSTNGTLYAVDLVTGQSTWSDTPGNTSTGAPGASGLAAAEGVLAVPLGGKLVAYERAGTGAAPALDLKITGGPDGARASQSATFTFASAAGTTTRCRLDRGAWAACTGTATYGGLADGPHTFEVESSDFGTGSALSLAARSFSVDTEGPEVKVSSGPRPLTNETSAYFTIAADGDGKLECSLDSGPWTTCPPRGSYTDEIAYWNLEEGTHRLDVRAKDRQGNSGETSHSWKIDRTPPSVRVTKSPPSPSYRDSGTLEWESDDPAATFSCSLRRASDYNSRVEPCTSPFSFSGLAEDSYTAVVIASDPAGNQVESPRTFVVDAEDPETTILSGPTGIIRAPQAKLDFGSSEPSRYDCRIDEGAWASCGNLYSSYSTSTTHLFTGLADGPHTIDVRAEDQAGSVDPTPARQSFSVKANATRTEILVSQNAAKVTFSSDDPGAQHSCSLDWSDYESCESPVQYGGLQPGYHNFRVRSVVDGDYTQESPPEYFYVPYPGDFGQPGWNPAAFWNPQPYPSFGSAGTTAWKPPMGFTSVRGTAGTLSSYLAAIRRRGVLGQRTFLLPYRSSQAGVVSVRVTNGTGRRRVVVLQGRRQAPSGTARKVKVGLTRAGTKLLRRGRRLRLTTEVRLTRPGAETQVARRSFWLEPR